MKITIFGTGYVGLVSGICLAEIGHEVIGVDVDQEKIDQLKRGKVPIYEPGLDELLVKNLACNQISFTTDARLSIQESDFVFIAVGTPSAINGSVNLKYVFEVATAIGKYLNHDILVVVKSTVPVGTGIRIKNKILNSLQQRGLSYQVDLASNPEFLKQGDAVKDFMRSDRIIIGVENGKVLDKMKSLYQPLDTKIISMDLQSAELAKYAANAFLATKISFINELSQLAEKLGADIEKIREGIGSDSRIGPYFLKAGCGYGGSCFPKDVNALIAMCREQGIDSMLLKSIEEINLKQKYLIFQRLNTFFRNLEGKTIALWGLAFKPNTDDMREAPSRVLIEALLQAGAKVQAYDPVATKIALQLYGQNDNFKLCLSKESALVQADALVIITEWEEFRELNFKILRENLRSPLIFDGRNMFEPSLMEKEGFKYFCIGRNSNAN